MLPLKWQKKSKPNRNKPKLSAVNRVLEETGFGRNILFKQARKQTVSKTKGNYPAPERIIDCIETGMSDGMRDGLRVEARHFR